MRVEVPLAMRNFVGGGLMKSHGVGKRHAKEPVVCGRDPVQNFCQIRLLLASEIRQGG